MVLMNKKQIFINYIKDYLNNPLEKLIKRDKSFSFLESVRKIYTIVWPRKAWKTYFSYQIISDLLENWIKKEQTLYIYLENDEFFPLELADLNLIFETYFEIVGYDKNKKYYLFFDEIQEVENWEKFALKVYSNYKNIELVLTGSSSKLLSKDIASGLRWKSFNIELLPLSFNEFLKFNNFKIEKYYSKTDLILLKSLFQKGLVYGFFPEIVLEEDEKIKLEFLQNYSDLIFYKDIIERYSFKNVKKIKLFKKL